ncbi:N-acetylmuramoyl-L-alanine amidase-like domain-containing protein [Fibrella sp. WM1]|uniref:N-acetylmuramoyl-L-alanine amidase-like domain-containing protein n=1 Tax=Fibrella musci TaxID=3242485 RepID=UPI0035229397
MKIHLLWLGLLATPVVGLAQAADDLRQIMIVPGRTTAETAIRTGETLIGKPYVPHTLEGNSTEQLVVNVQQFDCATFIETTLALALSEQELPEHYSATQLETTFKKYLTKLRYRHGRIDGYVSRLHYLSDWLRDNERKGIVQEVTRDIGGIQVQKDINYMTESLQHYPALSDPTTYKQMVSIQSDLSQQPFYLIPRKSIKAAESKIKEGDILMFTAARPGLDMRHVGYATWRNGKLYLLHASSDNHRVTISRQPIADYLASNRNLSGLRVARVRDTSPHMSQRSGAAGTLSAQR